MKDELKNFNDASGGDYSPSNDKGISRRGFLQNAAAVGAALVATRTAFGERPATSENMIEQDERIKEKSPKTAEQIAAFALRAGDADFTAEAKQRLKLSVLDALGCAIGAMGGEPVQKIRFVNEEFGGREQCTMIGGGKISADRAALYNVALVRYLDFMDNFAAKGEVCHPAVNFGAMLTVAEFANRSGKDLLVALAVAYQIHCRLIEETPTMRFGLQNTVPEAYAVAAGAAKLLGLNQTQTANAVALGGVSNLALANIQAEPLSNWKGLSSAGTAQVSVHNTFLARAGITGPLSVLDGPKGLFELVRSEPNIDWSKEGLDVAMRCSIKKYNGEFQSQTVIETALDMRRENNLDGGNIESITLDVPGGAYEVIGGGEYGSKDDPKIKEQADHNLKYMVAVALLDGDLYPEQYTNERINRSDVQTLLKKVTVRPQVALTARIPEELPCKITIIQNGRTMQKEKADYEGFYRRPMSPQKVTEKFNRLTQPFADKNLQNEIVSAVDNLEKIQVAELVRLLVRVRGTDNARG